MRLPIDDMVPTVAELDHEHTELSPRADCMALFLHPRGRTTRVSRS
ncbi:hypothetical protein AB0L59_10245 [Streptomyces sp. NPDC052109]